jgi:hypothetical protein
MTGRQGNPVEDLIFDATVTIVCDANEHARGRVALLATFRRLKATDSWLVTGADRGRRWSKRKAQSRGNADPQSGAEDDPAYTCKLCGRGLPPISKCKNVLLPFLNQAALQGESHITISKLRSGSI